MSTRVAVEGTENDLVPLICRYLRAGGYEVCYSHETQCNKTILSVELLGSSSQTIEEIKESNPDLSIVCNARGYFDFINEYVGSTGIPLLVLTGGGPDLEEEALKYTSHVLVVPFGRQDLYNKIEEIISCKQSTLVSRAISC